MEHPGPELIVVSGGMIGALMAAAALLAEGRGLGDQ